MQREFERGRVLMGRLETDDDLIPGLLKIVKKRGIEAGKVSAIGALQKARISYYHQERQEYQVMDFNQHLEIIGLEGNISLKDGEPIIHAHISLGDEEGKLFGGHLEEGTVVFACEYVIEELKGETFHRGVHQRTGLPLWME